METVDERLLAWLDSLGVLTTELAPLPRDVSPRRYFRVSSSQSEPAVLAVYPTSERASFDRFRATTRLFEAAGVRVPRIHASDPRSGLMLLEDLGSVSVFDLIEGPWRDLRPHIETALESLALLAARPAGDFAGINPLLDARRLAEELRDAQLVFLGSRAFSGESFEREALYAALDQLSSALASDPLVPSHRDFMSRNLMLPGNGSGIAVIDHQDACLAPRHYDLASLLNDSLFPSPAQEIELLGPIATDQVQLEAYRRCAVQRTLKATATYVKFAVRGFDRHLPLIAPTLARAAFQLERLPEGRSIPEGIFVRWRDGAAVREGAERLIRRSRKEASAGAVLDSPG